MRTVRVTHVLGLSLFIILSWMKMDVIGASLASFFSYILLTVSEFAAPSSCWRNGVWEFWIATLAWFTGCGFLLWRLLRRRQPVSLEDSSLTASVRTLILICFIAICAPLLAVVDPNLQGELATTRLLNPLSKGYVAMSSHTQNGEKGGLLKEWYERANARLLQREIAFRGSSSGTTALPAATEESTMLFLFGTDEVGRDVFSRVVYGTRVSLGIGFSATLGSMLLGTLIGFASGYSHRLVDAILMRLTDVMLSIPSIFLVITVVAFLGTSILSLIILLSVTGWMGIARTIRTEVIRLREKEFILAARLLHQSGWTILTKHMLPNLKPILVVAATLQFGSAVLAEASLSFLGLGIQPPTASWGNMLWQSLSSLHAGWWLGFFPGAMLAGVLIVLQYAANEQTRLL